MAVSSADYIQAVVHTVSKINIGKAGWAEHNAVARGLAAKAVTGGVLGAIGLGFHNPADHFALGRVACQLKT